MTWALQMATIWRTAVENKYIDCTAKVVFVVWGREPPRTGITAGSRGLGSKRQRRGCVATSLATCIALTLSRCQQAHSDKAMAATGPVGHVGESCHCPGRQHGQSERSSAVSQHPLPRTQMLGADAVLWLLIARQDQPVTSAAFPCGPVEATVPERRTGRPVQLLLLPL
jgi:hypothetical protein